MRDGQARESLRQQLIKAKYSLGRQLLCSGTMAERKLFASSEKTKQNLRGVQYPMYLRSPALSLAEWWAILSRSRAGTRRSRKSNKKSSAQIESSFRAVFTRQSGHPLRSSELAGSRD